VQSLREAFASAPPPRLREIGLLSPHPSVKGFVNVVEVGGPEQAKTEFAQPDSGLSVSLSVHTCRPRALNGKRLGEINLVDGSDTDLCTSGGLIVIRRRGSSDEFPIVFKLLGAPPGIIQWNARKLVEHHDIVSAWERDLRALQLELQPLIDDVRTRGDPRTVRTFGTNLVTIDPRNTAIRLMSGPPDEMRRLLGFRAALRDFYRNQDAVRARRVVGLILDSLLGSRTQQELSDQWRRELHDGPRAARRQRAAAAVSKPAPER
jgi:hypothetical protein